MTLKSTIPGGTSASNSLALIDIALDEINLPKRELRKHPKAQIEKLKQSIEAYGWVSPILLDQHNKLIAGAARVTAAKQLGIGTAPAVRVEHLSDAEVRAYRIADNKLAEAAEWDNDLLALELGEIEILGFDLELTGFETPEIDLLFSSGEAEADPADSVEAPDQNQTAISQQGDLWQIGDHRLYCGDALAPESYSRLLGGNHADMVFTDPPYNVPVKGHMGGLGSVQHREFVMASGEMSSGEFRTFLLKTMQQARAHTKNGGVVFTCMDWRSIAPLIEVTEEAELDLINLCVWNKTNGGMGSLYRSKHELVVVARVPGATHTNNVELGRHGRNRTNVWDYAGANTPNAGQSSDLKLHPTVKPIALVADAIQDVSKRGDTVLDMYGGSGTTMMAAERVGRYARLIELDPLYVDTAIRRFETEFGIEATLVATGQSFAEVEAERSKPANEDAPVVRVRTRTRPSGVKEVCHAD